MDAEISAGCPAESYTYNSFMTKISRLFLLCFREESNYIKKILSFVLAISLSLTLAPVAFADTAPVPATIQPSQVVYDVLNDDGVYENQEIISLNDSGPLPEYITDIIYFDTPIEEDALDSISKDNSNEIILTPISDISAEIQSEVSTRAVTKNESESNNTYTAADVYNDGEHMYGTISSVSDEDWFKVYWDVDGNADFYLEDIPSNCNYNLKVYSQPKNGGSLTLYKTAATTSSTERLLDVPVTNDKNYYMQVYSTNGSTSAWKYLLRAENTRIGDTFEPNDTSATAKTILKSSTANGTIHKLADVDYYKVSVTNGVLSVRLSTIPSGKDYRFDVYLLPVGSGICTD